MRFPVLILCFGISFSVSAQSELTPPINAFAEAGLGYSYNMPTYFYSVSEITMLGPTSFSRGINPGIRFGVLTNTRINIGITSRYSFSTFSAKSQEAMDYLNERHPDLKFLISGFNKFLMSSMQAGPIISLPIKKFNIDAELMVGYTTLHMPRVFIRGFKENNSEYHLYLYRSAQKILYKPVTFSLSGRYLYNSNVYFSSRFEFSYGNIDGKYSFELYPELDGGVAPHADDYQLFNFVGGIGFSLGRNVSNNRN